MTISRTLPIGLGLCVSVLFAFVVSSHQLDEKITSKEILLEVVDKKLQLLNKPSLKSIQSEDGDIIDCVDIYKQPAFDRPSLKNHTIQMEPSYYPKTEFPSKETENESSAPKIFQTWQKNGSCPTGTIPIRRTRKEDLLRATSLERYGRKYPYIAHSSSSHLESNKFERHTKPNITTNEYIFRKRSGAFLVTKDNYIGAKGDINVWNPYVENSEDYTTAEIWLVNGPDTNFESIEAGWMVNPSYYGDTKTRFFTYWTADKGQDTGCFDLSCSGFVQTNKEISLGGALTTISTREGVQYYLSISIFKDAQTGNWWLQAFGKNLGYWPSNLFERLNVNGGIAHFGGEVSSPPTKTDKHTATAMGSGEEAKSAFSAFIKRIKTVDNSFAEKYPGGVSEHMDEPNCYNTYNTVDNLKEPALYFGGPGGKNPKCT